MLTVLFNQKPKKAFVVFSGKTDIFWLKFLKSRFRHCFILLNDGKIWMSVDSLSSYTDVQVYHHLDPNFNLPAWLQKQGYIITPCFIRQKLTKPAPWSVFTCVESVKRILGLHHRFIITPWQLYCYLNKINNSSNRMKGNISWA